jgi:hypothetical protein
VDEKTFQGAQTHDDATPAGGVGLPCIGTSSFIRTVPPKRSAYAIAQRRRHCFPPAQRNEEARHRGGKPSALASHQVC